MQRRLAILAGSILLVGSAAAPASASKQKFFRAPGGKTYCVVSSGGGETSCDVKKPSYPIPPRPSTCIDHDWGIGASIIGTGEAQYVCTGQPLWLNPQPGGVLPVGASVSAGPVTCKSLKTAIRCENGGSRHGFKISQQTLKLF